MQIGWYQLRPEASGHMEHNWRKQQGSNLYIGVTYIAVFKTVKHANFAYFHIVRFRILTHKLFGHG